LGASSSGPDTVRGMTNERLFDFIALRLNHEKTDGMKAAISMVFSDSNEVWALELSNSVLNSTRGRVPKGPRRDYHTDAASLPGQSAELRCGGGQHHELRPGLQHRHTLMAPVRLTGVYDQVVVKQKFDVVFVRNNPDACHVQPPGVWSS
jgi:Alkyl sulfatase C-terminal